MDLFFSFSSSLYWPFSWLSRVHVCVRLSLPPILSYNFIVHISLGFMRKYIEKERTNQCLQQSLNFVKLIFKNNFAISQQRLSTKPSSLSPMFLCESFSITVPSKRRHFQWVYNTYIIHRPSDQSTFILPFSRAGSSAVQ